MSPCTRLSQEWCVPWDRHRQEGSALRPPRQDPRSTSFPRSSSASSRTEPRTAGSTSAGDSPPRRDHQEAHSLWSYKPPRDWRPVRDILPDGTEVERTANPFLLLLREGDFTIRARHELDGNALLRLVSLRGPRHAERATSAALAKAEGGLQTADRLSAHRGPHHFFESTSLNASLRGRVLDGVKALRFAPPPLSRGAFGGLPARAGFLTPRVPPGHEREP